MIEAAKVEACEALAAVHARAFDKPWTETEIRKLLENPAVFALVSRDQAIDGFVMGWAAAGDAEILTVAVIPEARRKGVGAALITSAGVAALVRGAASMFLEVSETNDAARALYTKLGFAEAGRRRDYYATDDGWVDAIVMRRGLPRAPV